MTFTVYTRDVTVVVTTFSNPFPSPITAPVIIMSLHPSEPVVMEGDSFQITCQVTGQ